MFTMGAFYESIDGAAADHNIAAVGDQSLTFAGDNLRVPSGLSNLVGYAALADATAYAYAKIDSPSLRMMFPNYVTPREMGAIFVSPQQQTMFPRSPIPLVGDEDMQWINNSDAAGAIAEYGFVWFSDGPIAPVEGRIHTIRATSAITAVAGTWVNGALTFNEALPFGRYAIVGMRCHGPTTIAGRLVFVGGPWRPGVIAVGDKEPADHPLLRFGKMGVWGEFDSVAPPSVDIIGSAGTAQIFHLDVIKLS